jgi:hypothetical protein
MSSTKSEASTSSEKCESVSSNLEEPSTSSVPKEDENLDASAETSTRPKDDGNLDASGEPTLSRQPSPEMEPTVYVFYAFQIHN